MTSDLMVVETPFNCLSGQPIYSNNYRNNLAMIMKIDGSDADDERQAGRDG